MKRLATTCLLLLAAVLCADANWQSRDSNYNVSISTGPPVVSCSYTPITTATQNVAYTGATPSASGGTPGYTYSETGSLPPGFSLNTSTGVISGTDTSTGTYSGIQMKVTDSASNTANCGSSFAIAVTGYQGVGDIVTSGWTAYGGVFAFTAAIAAAGTQKLVNLINNDTGETCNILAASTGTLGLTANCTNGNNGQTLPTWSFVQIFSGAIISGGSMITGSDDQCTAIVGDQIIGAGIVDLYITSIGFCLNGSGGNYTVSDSSVNVTEDVTDTGWLSVTEVYNQVGSGPAGWLQSNGNYKPTLTQFCSALSYACLEDGFAGDYMVTSGNFTPATGNVSLWAVVDRFVYTGAAGCYISENGGSSLTCAGSNSLKNSTAANNATTAGGTSGTVSATATDLVLHALSGVINGASPASNITVDGVATTGSATGNTTAAPSSFVPTNGSYQRTWEAGFLDNVALTGTQATNLCKNAQARIGASNFGAVC